MKHYKLEPTQTHGQQRIIIGKNREHETNLYYNSFTQKSSLASRASSTPIGWFNMHRNIDKNDFLTWLNVLETNGYEIAIGNPAQRSRLGKLYMVNYKNGDAVVIPLKDIQIKRKYKFYIKFVGQGSIRPASKKDYKIFYSPKRLNEFLTKRSGSV